jgi:anti-sigma B factor antagonist
MGASGGHIPVSGPIACGVTRRNVSASISIEERAGVWIVTVAGELDYADCAAFRIRIDHVLMEMPAACIVDLSGVDYLDSSALGILLSLYRAYEGGPGKLVLVASETVDGILGITRLDKIFVTAADIEEALTIVGD